MSGVGANAECDCGVQVLKVIDIAAQAGHGLADRLYAVIEVRLC